MEVRVLSTAATVLCRRMWFIETFLLSISGSSRGHRWRYQGRSDYGTKQQGRLMTRFCLDVYNIKCYNTSLQFATIRIPSFMNRKIVFHRERLKKLIPCLKMFIFIMTGKSVVGYTSKFARENSSVGFFFSAISTFILTAATSKCDNAENYLTQKILWQQTE